VLRDFKAQYSSADHLANLASWHAFEQTHPHAFSNMYFLWVQKREAV
jgi:hypothetical protein